MVILNLTTSGINDLDYYNNCYDIRIKDFNSLTAQEQISMVRVSFYNQIKRINSDYDFKGWDTFLDISKDEKILKEKYKNTNFIFSPYQMLPSKYVDECLKIKRTYTNHSKSLTKENLISMKFYDTEEKEENSVLLEESEEYNLEEIPLVKYISDNRQKGISKLTEELFNKYRYANKDIFYPLIGSILNYLNFKCKVSRNGTNYERYDAIITDYPAIPIEIKSPGEEVNISVKAIRQALENKITLLSRKNYKTDWNTSTLVIGYSSPNNRAEVNQLIRDIKVTYNISIGVVDFKSLLEILINKVLNKKSISRKELNELEGIIKIEKE